MFCTARKRKTYINFSGYKARRLTGELRYGRSKVTEKKRKVGESTVKRELSFCAAFLARPLMNGRFCNYNPVRKVIKGLKENKRVRYVLPDEAEKLRFTLPAWLKPIVVIGCHTGLREGNIVNLTVSQCDFHNDRININDREMKNSEPFSIGMTSEVKANLQSVLKERMVISPYVFTDENGRPYSRSAVSMAFRRACKRGGISDLHFHDLRHDFATLLINNGASLYQVQHALGHKDQRMSARYAHLLPENRDVINFIEGKGTTTVLLQSAQKLKGSLS